ncbi:MAG: hypothetical protein ACREQQ_02120 [Candidatus Binatia bacterium]
MPKRPFTSRAARLFLLSLAASAVAGPPRLPAEEDERLAAEMLLDLELLTDREFAAEGRDLARRPPAEEMELLENLEALEEMPARGQR